MIHYFLNTVAHTTPIHKRKTSSHQIITREYLSPRCSSNKENLPRCLNSPNAFPREDNRRETSKHNIVRTEIKVSILFQYPSHTVPTHRWRRIRLRKLKKLHWFYLPTIKIKKESHIPNPLPHPLPHQRRLQKPPYQKQSRTKLGKPFFFLIFI